VRLDHASSTGSISRECFSSERPGSWYCFARLLSARYVQVKRRNQSFCFLCDLSDTGLNVKELLVAATTQQPFTDVDGGKRPVVSRETIRLLRADTTTALEDNDVLSECEDMKKSFASTGVAVLYVVTQRGTNATGSNSEWEAVDVVSTEQEQHQLMDETSAMTD
jgi:hypothetical protein